MKKPSSARNHTGHITCLCISRDGTVAATGEAFYQPSCHFECRNNPWIGMIISGGTDSLVNIWQMNSHELQWTMDGHLSSVTSVALAANGLFAVSGSEDHTARVWGLTLGLVVSVFRVCCTALQLKSHLFQLHNVTICLGPSNNCDDRVRHVRLKKSHFL